MRDDALTCGEGRNAVLRMSRTLRIRHVPDGVHRRLKSGAARAGRSVSDYVLREIEQALSRPTRAEVFARIAELPPVELDPPSSEVLRETRGCAEP